MIRRTTSILLIIQFAGTLAAPLVQVDNCDMVCCVTKADSEMILEMQQDCEESMSECHPALFLPVVNAPKPVLSLEKLFINSSSSVELDPSFLIQIPTAISRTRSENIPPDINLPLLV